MPSDEHSGKFLVWDKHNWQIKFIPKAVIACPEALSIILRIIVAEYHVGV